jgi:acetoin utilization deacetylase AcuC-like enzyme
VKTAFVWHESFFWHYAGEGALYEPYSHVIENLGQAESPESKRRIKNLLERTGLIDELLVIKPSPASEADLLRFHTPQHIENVKNLSSANGGLCGDSTMVGRGSYEIAALAAGAAIEAVKYVVSGKAKNAYALTRPPGHHAMAHEGMGYCIFNNIVIAAKYAREILGIEKILIIDWDAHHGNGTEDAFYDNPHVLYISLHQDGLEPIGRGLSTHRGTGAGEGFTINIPLPPGSGDAAYKYAFQEIIMPKARAFAPDLVLVSAGQDANIFDPLARMMLSAEGYRHMTRELMTLANGRVICIHEGGYCPSYVPFCTHGIITELSASPIDAKDPFIYAMKGTGYDKLHKHQKEVIDNF